MQTMHGSAHDKAQQKWNMLETKNNKAYLSIEPFDVSCSCPI